jgi:hypothetical protein
VKGRLGISKIVHLVIEITALVREDLVRIFFATGAALKFG